MYFASRLHAGRLLAQQIVPRYKDEPTAVLALSDGGVVVGMQISQQLSCSLGMLLVDEIELPHEAIAIAGMTQDGSFAYNHEFSTGEIEEMVSEYRGFLEEKKIEKMQAMHRLLSNDGLVRKELLQDRNIVVVSDGMSSGFSIDLALQFLKPVSYKKLIVATPMASIKAVDRMHILADDIYCLNVLEDYISTDHYYDTPDVPDHTALTKAVATLIKQWNP